MEAAYRPEFDYSALKGNSIFPFKKQKYQPLDFPGSEES